MTITTTVRPYLSASTTETVITIKNVDNNRPTKSDYVPSGLPSFLKPRTNKPSNQAMTTKSPNIFTTTKLPDTKVNYYQKQERIPVTDYVPVVTDYVPRT